MTVFAVLAHGDPTMLARLSGALAPHRVVVHIDARRPLEPFIEALAHLPNAQVIASERVTVNWGGWSQVEATLRLYHEIVPGLQDDEQIVLLSGQCYPLRPVEDIVRQLSENIRPIHARGVRYSDIRDRSRTREFHPYDLFPVRQSGLRRVVYAPPRKVVQKLAPLLPRRIAGEDTLVLGSQWTVLTAQAIREAIFPAYDILRRRLRFTFAPEETFFTTALYGSTFAAQTQESAPSAYVGEKMAQYPNLHEMDESMVKTYTALDWAILSHSDALFVRKVSTERSTELLDTIDRERTVRA